MPMTTDPISAEVAAKVAALRVEAAAHAKEASDSFDRCDTDGFLSQWASGLSSLKCAAEARLLEAGGVHDFLTVFDLAGNWVPSKMISTRFGSRWMLLDADGKRTGEFLPVGPARRSTLAKHGYVEGRAMFPARVDYIDGGGGVASVRVGTVKACRDHEPPVRVLTADRWRGD